MDLQTADDSESRFSAYVEGLVRVIGHADRAGPLRDYCTGLLLPGERKSVEPMAAVTAPGGRAAQHQSLHHFVANAAWSDEAVLGRCASWCCRRSSGTARSRPGSSTTPAFPRRARTRSAWRASIAASSASRTTARSRCRCRSPMTTPACRWPIGCICRRTGPTDADRRAQGRRAGGRSASRPSRRSRWSRSGRPARPAFRPASCWWMPATASTPSCADRHQRAGAAPMSPASSRRPAGVAAGQRAAAAEAVVGPRAATQAHAPRRRAQAGHRQGTRLGLPAAPGRRSPGARAPCDR